MKKLYIILALVVVSILMVFAGDTIKILRIYHNGIFTPMENLLADLKAHDWKRRSVALIENGTWAATSGKLMRAELEQMKEITILGEMVSLKSAATPAQEEQLAALADEIVATLN